MGMFDFFKKKEIQNKGVTAEDLFREDKEKDVAKHDCTKCSHNNTCTMKMSEKDYLCGFVQDLEDYDKTKKSILLFDDNMGVISFLEDDLYELQESNVINLDDYNIIKFSSQYAAFHLQATLKAYDGLNIEYGFFDITLGGGVYDEKKGNIILDGVDAFISAKEYNKDLKFVFFTGNKLNPYINKNKIIINKFKESDDSDIKDHILYKTSLSPDDRRKYIAEFLTK